MRSRLQWVFNFVALVLIAFALAGVFWLFAKAIETGATFLGAALAALATMATVLIGRYHERRKDAEATRRAQLGPTYEKLAGIMSGHTLSARQNQKMIVDFMRKAVVYASPATIKAFRVWRTGLPGDAATVAEQRANMLRYERFVKAMRKDVGISNWMLDEGDLLRAVLDDFDEVFPDELVPPEPQEEVRVSASPSRQTT